MHRVTSHREIDHSDREKYKYWVSVQRAPNASIFIGNQYKTVFVVTCLIVNSYYVIRGGSTILDIIRRFNYQFFGMLTSVSRDTAYHSHIR
jgi:hypothetical protein